LLNRNSKHWDRSNHWDHGGIEYYLTHVQIKAEYNQLLEMATAFRVRALGTALVVILDSADFRDARRSPISRLWFQLWHCPSPDSPLTCPPPPASSEHYPIPCHY